MLYLKKNRRSRHEHNSKKVSLDLRVKRHFFSVSDKGKHHMIFGSYGAFLVGSVCVTLKYPSMMQSNTFDNAFR